MITQKLEAFCQEEWAALPSEKIKSLIHKYHKRLQAVIDVKGGNTRFLSMDWFIESIIYGCTAFKDKEFQDTRSVHDLAPTVEVTLPRDENGFGLDIIINENLAQILSIREQSAAARDGNLKPGDIFIKVGNVNVMDWTLRKLGQLLRKTQLGEEQTFLVYRDFLPLPEEYTEYKLSVGTNQEEQKTSAEKDMDDEHEFCTTPFAFSYDSSKGPFISLDYSIFSKNNPIVLTVGTSSTCDVMLHKYPTEQEWHLAQMEIKIVKTISSLCKKV